MKTGNFFEKFNFKNQCQADLKNSSNSFDSKCRKKNGQKFSHEFLVVNFFDFTNFFTLDNYCGVFPSVKQ